MRTCPREAGPPGPQLSSPGERERHTAMPGGAGEVNMLQSLFSLQLPLTHNLSNKVRGMFFSKKSSLVFIIVLKCILHVYVYICIFIMWLYNNKTLVMWNGTEIKPFGECRLKMIPPPDWTEICHKVCGCRGEFPPVNWCECNSKYDTVYNDRRCLWCNGYRRRMWTRRHEFKSWTNLITFHIALIPLGKVWIQLFSLQLGVNSRAD